VLDVPITHFFDGLPVDREATPVAQSRTWLPSGDTSGVS
jgi:hypothetical protein